MIRDAGYVTSTLIECCILSGGKRTLKLPPELAYGIRGAGCKGGELSTTFRIMHVLRYRTNANPPQIEQIN